MVAAVHAGWKGALDGVIASAVAAMEAEGASARPHHRRGRPLHRPGLLRGGPGVPAAVRRRTTRARSASSSPAPSPDKRLFDLPGFVLWRLEQAGVGDAEWIGRDTCAEETLFFSNRRAFKRGEADYGRLLSAIVLA